MEAVVHYDKNSDYFEYAKDHPNKNEIKGLDEVKHISLVIADARHPPILGQRPLRNLLTLEEK